uniref:Uncharacterized protein n=1 Tax=Anguilla anguilla TaxID=7936 RepID=A0A0E9PZ61_ANGAN
MCKAVSLSTSLSHSSSHQSFDFLNLNSSFCKKSIQGFLYPYLPLNM